jgi:histidinol-phosphate phosphatase family protein
MKAVIVAGGEGSRLGEISKAIPKSMVRVGDRPILEHQILLFRRYGFREILVLTGRLGEVIENHFGDGSAWDVRIEYCRESRPFGTAGAVKEAESLLQEDFLLLYGDVMADINLDEFVAFHREKGGVGSLVLHPNDHPADSDLVEIDRDGRITRFLPKPRQPGLYCRNLVNAGLYVLSPELFRHIDKGVPADFGKNIFPAVLGNGGLLYGYVTAEYLKDMGTVERLRQVNEDYASGRIDRWNKSNPRPAVFLDRDGTINNEVGLISREEDFELVPGAARGVRLLNKSDYLSVVITNQSVIARGLCGFEDVERIHAKMETLLGNEGAYLDSILYCPHHPEKGFPEERSEYKVECTCRKPATGLIETAVRRLNIDLSASFFIGDSTRDVETGRRLGIRTILLRTGFGGKDNRYPAKPDFIFDDLEQAAVFITQECPPLPHNKCTAQQP